ncbi:unnamed protein product [Danaus chrysippus]|uniref:(African queen) hypothetical protein n=1 Tax=Danaus chrysippus TaxID=151541 RepID=A0A8J2QFM6_9NEOP|nr:unnamed protein product [Danaus chrysippus]
MSSGHKPCSQRLRPGWHGIGKVITGIYIKKNINKFINRALIRAGSHGRDLSDGSDIQKYPCNKRTTNGRLTKTGRHQALAPSQQVVQHGHLPRASYDTGYRLPATS